MNVILLFGEMGSGKSYLGRQIAHALDYEFIEGDDLAGPEMKTAIEKLSRITEEMVDDLVFRILDKVSSISDRKGVVVSQALYREKHRTRLLTHWSFVQGHNVEAFWVKTPTMQHIRQLRARPGGWKWVTYWLLSKPFFQKPRHWHDVIDNKEMT